MAKNGHGPNGKQRYLCRLNNGGCGYGTTNPKPQDVVNQRGDVVEKGRTAPLRFARALGGQQRFVITSAQNATPVHESFLSALKQYCEFNTAELIVIPYRYKNPTSRWTESQQNKEWWSSALVPYLYNQRKKLNPNLILVGDVKTLPTAERPLSSFEGLTHGESGIIGHPKMQLRTIATPQSAWPKIMTTTGSVTLRNYTDSKAGKKGEFHHVFGAIVVDVVGKRFHMRQINATPDGAFIDLDTEYRPDGARPASPAASLTCGDIHLGECDPAVMAARLEVIEAVDPEYLVFHDIANGRTVNPHETKNWLVQHALHKAGARNVRAEIESVAHFLREYGGDRKKLVVPSNHNDWFARWVNDFDPRKDPENVAFYLETAKELAASAHLAIEGPKYADAFTYWMRRLLADCDNVLLPDRGDSVLLAGIEHNYHGDQGPNGSRGSVLNMSKLGVRLNIGHVHSPEILGACYAAGTSTFLNPPYTRGHPGSWLNTDILTYANGKRTLINYIDGQWRFT